MSTAVKLASRDARSIRFQEASLDIWDKKIDEVPKDGTLIDRTTTTPRTRRRGALADVEKEVIREHLHAAVPVGVAPRADPRGA